MACIFRFLRLQYYAVLGDDPDVPLLHKIGLLGAADEGAGSSQHPAAGCTESSPVGPTAMLPRSTLKKRLEIFLQVFAAVVSPRQLFQHQLLFQFYGCLLSRPETQVARLALDCMLTYKPSYLVPYKDNFKRILDDKHLRDELIVFNPKTSSESGEDVAIDAEHRADLVPYLVRVVFGRFLAKSRSNRAREQTVARCVVYSIITSHFRTQNSFSPAIISFDLPSIIYVVGGQR